MGGGALRREREGALHAGLPPPAPALWEGLQVGGGHSGGGGGAGAPATSPTLPPPVAKRRGSCWQLGSPQVPQCLRGQSTVPAARGLTPQLLPHLGPLLQHVACIQGAGAGPAQPKGTGLRCPAAAPAPESRLPGGGPRQSQGTTRGVSCRATAPRPRLPVLPRGDSQLPVRCPRVGEERLLACPGAALPFRRRLRARGRPGPP